MIDDCSANLDMGRKVLDSPDRWSIRLPAPEIPKNQIRAAIVYANPSVQSSYEQVWAAAQNAKLHKVLLAIASTRAIFPGAPNELSAGACVYAPGDKSSYITHLIAYDVVSDTAVAQLSTIVPNLYVRCHVPLTCIGGVDLILDQLSRVRSHGALPVSLFHLNWTYCESQGLLAVIDNINSAMELTPPCKKQCTHTSSAAQPHVAADTDADVDGDDSDDDMLGSLQEALEREADAYDQCMGTEEADETHGHFDVWVADAAKRTGEATVERHEAILRRRAKVTSKDCKSIVCHDDGEVDVSRIDPEYVQDEVEMLRVLGINGGIGDGDGGGPDSGSSSSNSHTTGDGGDCMSRSMSMWACSFNELCQRSIKLQKTDSNQWAVIAKVCLMSCP